jgi:DNA-binding transcriptional regulator YiaG
MIPAREPTLRRTHSRGEPDQQSQRMPNIAAVLKSEIGRIARKEVRTETQDLKKASVQYRSHIAALRRRIESLERQLKRATRGKARPAAAAEESSDEQGPQRRFSAKRLAAQRHKLGLSAADFAALLGVSAQSIYKWEFGKSRPRARQIEAIAALRGIGKREAVQRLEALAKKKR